MLSTILIDRKSPEQLRVLNGGNTYKPEYFPTPTDPIFETTFIPTLNAASFPSTNFDPDVEVQMHNRVAVAPAMTATALVITDTLLIETVVTATIGDELATITLQSLSNFEGLDGLANQTSRVYGNATTTLALTTARGSGRPGLATDLPEFSDDAAIVGNGPKGFILLAVLTGLGALVF